MTYEPFWRMMNERRISTYSLEVDYGFNKAFIHRLKHNKNMNLSSIDYICDVFCCPVVHIRNDKGVGADDCL
jgi:DNA-binding Xre family transcriptional regulator